MKVTQLYIVRHLLAVICSLIGVALLAIGANAALDLNTSEAAKVVSTKEKASAIQLALFFGGYGVQSRHENYMIPTDAVIWKERDVRHEGMSVETVLDAIKERGARATLAVLDASRRNPYERRFRSYSHGLAPINAPNNALTISSHTPGKVADDTKGEHSVLVTELLNELNAQVSAEGVFNRTRVAVFRVSNGEQMPSVSSSLLEDVRFSPSKDSDSPASSLAPISTESALVAQK
jgi:uncharacterized caspase-like protein